ncbi:MlaD family protein [Nocardia sp. NPDC057668]|uniref:MlaD family protein n=1 Tax=Nocardia sp. NPDC057668 TaxID=3346202 RepID=UPI0036702503
MIIRLLGSRGFMSAAGALAVAVLAVVGYLIIVQPLRAQNAYCAIMSDGIGLYPGNEVTMRGVPIGTVRSVEPRGRTVRVDFDVDADYALAGDVSATTVSPTIIADRALALLSPDPGGPRRDGSQCITKTLTPKSMTETLGALAELSRQTLGPDGESPEALRRGVAALDAATTGTGPQLNEIIRKLGTALNSPDAAIGHLAGVIDSLSALSRSIAGNWGDIKSMLVRLSSVLGQVNNELFSRTVEIIDGFQRVLPMLNDITTLFGDPIFRVLDSTVPLAEFIGAHANTLRDLIGTAPVLTGAFAAVTDLRPDATGISYRPPRFAIPQPQAEQVCAAVNAVTAGTCAGAANGLVDLRLVQLVLGMAGAR